MSPNVLRRCSLCKRFHASYLLPDSEFGKLYLCYDCWKACYAPQPTPTTEPPVRPKRRR
jgi:hypothetical protein